MIVRCVIRQGLAGFLALATTEALAQEPFPRASQRAGAIVAVKGGEELQFPREPGWRPAIVRQDVVGGDTLRTGEIGTLGITFTDQTTIRVGRQSTLVVNQVAAASQTGNTELSLPAGNIWARASRGGTGVTVKTPAASAAIRGTDWSLAVQGDRTSIMVMEGVVEFSNPQGSVTVRQGEGASARIGEKPTKIVLVRSDDREQMLFYMELRGLFRGLPATPLDGAARRDARSRLAASPVSARTTADWVAIAENGLGQDPLDVVLEAVAEARRRLGQKPAYVPGPSEDWTAREVARRAQGSSNLSARLDLVEAMLAGSAKRYKAAAELFARAVRGTSGRQRLTAQCGYFAAATLAEPKRMLPMPKLGGADQNVCTAYVTGFGKGLPEAEAILRRTEKAAPRHLLSSMLSAQVSLLLDRREEMRATIERMRATDPDSPETLLASGYLKSAIDSDLDGAVADFTRGTQIAPGDAAMWNGLGLAQSSRDANVEAEAAFRRGIAADPDDPVTYANLAIQLLDESRVEEAGVLIDKALALDPSLYVGYTAKGRYYLQKGDMAKAMEFMLAGSAANPASAQGLLGTAIAQYQSGDIELAEQAFDNADRLDKNDPVTSIARTAIAVDQLDADAAITNAREAVRRYRNRGGYFAALASTRTGGSYLGQAYRLLGLEDWGRYYTDRVSDPFTATSYFDQAIARRARPFFARPTLDQVEGYDFGDGAGSLIIQGLLLDPLAASGRIGRIDLLRRPFIDVEFGGSLIRRNGRNGWQNEVSVQAFSNAPIPTAVALSASQTRTSDRPGGRAGGEDSRQASVFIGMAPNAAERFLIWGAASTTKPDLLSPAINVFDADSNTVKSYQAGAGWSHTFGYRNVLTGAVVATRADQSERRAEVVGLLDPFIGFFPSTFDTRQRRDVKVDAVTAAVSHMLGFGDFTLRTGIEGQRGRNRGFSRLSETLSIPGVPLTLSNETEDPVRSSFNAGRAYANLMWQPSDMFKLEGGVQGLSYDTNNGPRKNYVDPRIGVGLSPLEGHWLRATWRRDTELPNGFTLSPITTIGLVPNGLPLQLGGRKDTAALRWDAEWTQHVFTAVEYQSQRATNLRVGIPDTLDDFSVGKARIDYLTATANIWLTHGIGVFGTVGMADSSTRDASGVEVDVPFVPQRFARAGLTFVHPSRIKFSVIENYIGERYDSPGGIKLDPLWTTDLTASYETPNRRLLIGLSLLNAFDKRYEQVAARVGSEAVLGAGRTIAGSLKVRF
jgi:tetratricopeptide (TPR) repeat protein